MTQDFPTVLVASTSRWHIHKGSLGISEKVAIQPTSHTYRQSVAPTSRLAPILTRCNWIEDMILPWVASHRDWTEERQRAKKKKVDGGIISKIVTTYLLKTF